MANSVTSFEVQNNAYSINPDLNFDSTPTIGSTNPVTSNGIALAVQAASIGSNISFGRVDGSDVGYASISYGDNNIASNTSGIVFGSNNICSAPYTITSGTSNYIHGAKSSIFGSSNGLNGMYCNISGDTNTLNVRIQPISETSYPDNRAYQVYIGYVNPTTKKIYSDSGMTQEIPINRELSTYTHYFVNLKENGTQHVGDVYVYQKAANVITLTKLAQYYNANFTNACFNVTYEYHGPCYYNGQNDKIYSDINLTNEITIDSNFRYNKTLFLDLMDNTLLLYNNTNLLPYGSAPKWVRVTTYVGSAHKGGGSSRLTGVSKYYGRHAYINDEFYTGSEKFHVYTSPDKTPETDITDQLLDGEVIADISKLDGSDGRINSYRNLYVYTFDSSHRMVSVSRINIANCCSIQGINNHFGSNYGQYVDHSYSSIIGDGNEIYSKTDTGFTVGQSNLVTVSHSMFAVIGDGNKVSTPQGSGTNTSATIVLGSENTVNSSDDTAKDLGIFGTHNNIFGRKNHDAFIFGGYNDVTDAHTINIEGYQNKINFDSYISVIGSDNSVNEYVTTAISRSSVNPVITRATLNKDGTITIGGIVYDVLINPSSLVSLPTKQIFCVYGRRGYNYSNFYDSDDDIVGYAYSSTGRELIWLDDNVLNKNYTVNIFGSNNKFIRSFDSFETNNNNDQFNYIIGNYNELYADHSKGIGLIGYHLICYGGGSNPNCAPQGYTVIGAYNDHSNSSYLTMGCKTQFVVGIGTADNDRKNGFAVTSAGVLLAPECPDTINSATALVSGMSNKAVVTYGMLQDYAPRTPGAVGKPALLTLDNIPTTAWSNNEYEVPITGMTTDAVVILQPSGDPTGFYTNKLYLKSQTTDKIVIGCITTPLETARARVVYWL